jgi:hypothetical protein
MSVASTAIPTSCTGRSQTQSPTGPETPWAHKAPRNNAVKTAPRSVRPVPVRTANSGNPGPRTLVTQPSEEKLMHETINVVRALFLDFKPPTSASRVPLLAEQITKRRPGLALRAPVTTRYPAYFPPNFFSRSAALALVTSSVCRTMVFSSLAPCSRTLTASSIAWAPPVGYT